MKTGAYIIIFSTLLFLPGVSLAGGESGLYIGGGIGAGFTDVDQPDPAGGADFHLKGYEGGYKIIAGYNFGIIPLLDLGIEGSYVDFGEIEDTSAGRQGDAHVTGYDVFALAAATFGPFAVFAKGGFIDWDSDITLGGKSVSDSGSDPALGVGARVQLFSLSIRAEYETFDVTGVKELSMISVSGLYTF